VHIWSWTTLVDLTSKYPTLVALRDPRVWHTLATGALTRRSTGVRWAACTPWFAVTVRGPLLILEKAAAFEHHS
jgi:hypothetical protein